ncbi:MAG: hypothetical protein A3J93_01780 [Candidatus Magasanikbacteria bacterium RIFOXYC2_FULL_42_28]|uniref:Uncharacterized protein n=1 Tax=Candidatus Magasanikbacteria bacterium RIFOXYC2_FULL_42_28 TaxID=1798704 RepID=A0A1F6NXZ4_9BACT|nr:MAG: hypothetical protein A3J93_01780 [Candidatus Magasanikbacteria bacterium RIFOXYC2_FULL_42_28]
MPIGKIQPDSWKEALKFMGHCPLCNGIYSPNSAQKLNSAGAANLVHLTCEKCSGGFIAMVMVSPAGLSSVGMVTDLNYGDAMRLHNKEEITMDEVIEGYEFLKQKWY